MTNQSIDVVKNAMEYYDINMEKYNAKFKNVKYVKFKISLKDNEHNVIFMYDKNKNEVYRSKYEIVGVYNNSIKSWTWAWSIPHLYKNASYISRKILYYGLDRDPSERFLKSVLTSSRFRTNSSVQIDILVAIASYLAKNPSIYKFDAFPNSPHEEDLTIKLQNKASGDSNAFSSYYMFLLDE